MLEFHCFYDFVGFKALNADRDPFWRAVDYSADIFQIGKEASACYAGDL